MTADGDRVSFVCNGHPVDVEVAPGESLLSVVRERLGLVSVKDGCAPQGQCGCCTVLVDGDPRVACVTPAVRAAGRAVTTVEGLDVATRAALVDAFVATGASQCGFCTPGIIVRLAALLAKGRTTDTDVSRALAAHLCRCTGWRTIADAFTRVASPSEQSASTRDLAQAGARATLEGGVGQRADADVPLGRAGFADDIAPRPSVVAVPAPPDWEGEGAIAAGVRWVLGASVHEARTAAGKVQGRRTPNDEGPPLPLPERPEGGVRVATAWVEPAALELDASWCAPGQEPASPLANGGAFGAKGSSQAPVAARELADRIGQPVRVVYAREDAVRLGPKRPPIAASSVLQGDVVVIRGTVVGPGPMPEVAATPYRLDVDACWNVAAIAGPPVSPAMRAFPLAEHALLVEGALDAAGADRTALIRGAREDAVLLDTCVANTAGGLAGARVVFDDTTGSVARVEVRVRGGDVLDEVVLRSYAFGAAHMALGWVLSEGVAVDPATGEVLDLTIRSFGIIRARDMPAVHVTIVDDAGGPRPVSDAVFAAVAAAAWNALAHVEGVRPEELPARSTRAGRLLRR